MLKLEEYIYKRKKEDGINELDVDKRSENTCICVNYIFEYFNNYLESTAADKQTVLHEEKIDKYLKIIKDYDPDIQKWLILMYSSYGKHMHRNLGNYITDTYFLLYDSEAEFRALSYDIYPKAIKKFRFLDNQSEQVFLFIKDYHRIRSLFSPYSEFHVCESIDEWITDTYQKYGVNLYKFCSEWIEYYSDNPDIWPVTHKKKSQYYDKYINEKNTRYSSLIWDYDYKQKNNLFNLDSLYRNMPKKSFTRNRKQHFETLLLYCWLDWIETDEEYWHTYLQTVLPSL
ncbi:MAG: hypothetical protein AAGU12_15055 [Clostridiales bacterium]